MYLDKRCTIKYITACKFLEKYRPGEKFRARDTRLSLKRLFDLVDLGYLKHNVEIGLQNVFECEFERTDKEIDPCDFRRTYLPLSLERLYIDYGDGQWHPVSNYRAYKELIKQGIMEFDRSRKAIRMKKTLADVLQEVNNARRYHADGQN